MHFSDFLVSCDALSSPQASLIFVCLFSIVYAVWLSDEAAVWLRFLTQTRLAAWGDILIRRDLWAHLSSVPIQRISLACSLKLGQTYSRVAFCPFTSYNCITSYFGFHNLRLLGFYSCMPSLFVLWTHGSLCDSQNAHCERHDLTQCIRVTSEHVGSVSRSGASLKCATWVQNISYTESCFSVYSLFICLVCSCFLALLVLIALHDFRCFDSQMHT